MDMDTTDDQDETTDQQTNHESDAEANKLVTVVSEVNLFLTIDNSIQPLHNSSNSVAKIRFSLSTSPLLLWSSLTEASYSISSAAVDSSQSQILETDKDGDIEVPRIPKGQNHNSYDQFILIEHMNSTTLDLVAHQIWRGAFVLADFILEHANKYFFGKTILELGSGTGFSSIVVSIVAKKVIVTDLDDENITGLIKANFTHNIDISKSEISIEPLDFLNLNWTKEIENLVAESEVIIAADVIYHDRITEGFVITLKKILVTGKAKNIFIALEKRYVFTLSDLDIVAPAYDHFLKELESLLCLQLDESKFQDVDDDESVSSTRSVLNYSGKKVSISIKNLCLAKFPIHFNYEPSKDVILWHIQSFPIS